LTTLAPTLNCKAGSEVGASASGLKMRKSKLGAAEEDEGDKSDEEDDKKQNVDQGLNEVPIECAVCLQTCVYPVQLPCKHIFCFLCVKGVTLQSKRCAMCRQEIPPDYLYHPDLLSQVQESETSSYEDGGQWFYEGRGGWWQYDQRTSVEIEAAMAREEERCELLIAGSLYIIDFEHMLQYRRNDPSRRRRIKRDQASGPKKGVAGLRLDVVEEPQEDEEEEETPDGDNDAEDAEADDPAVELAVALDGLSVEPGGGGQVEPGEGGGQVGEDQGPDTDQH